MKRIMIFLTRNYRESDYYIRKKAKYTALFLMQILICVLMILAAESIVGGIVPNQTAAAAGFVSAFLSFFYLLKKGHLELCLDLMILSGVTRCLMIVHYQDSAQFYIISLLIILTAGVIHTRKYQLYLSYGSICSLYLIKVISVLTKISREDPAPSSLLQAVFSLLLLTIYIVMVQFVVNIIEREIRISREMTLHAETDTLTGAGNRRKFNSVVKLLNDAGIPTDFSLLMLDLDHFKMVNDNYGHDKGDQILRELVRLLKGTIREEDSLYRWGGEEFLILMPSFPRDALIPTADRIRTVVETHEFPAGLRVTISLGAASGGANENLSEIIQKADKALYQAKQTGRNRVCS